MNTFLLSSSSSSASSTSSTPNFTVFTQSQNPNHLFKFSFKLSILPLHSSTPSYHSSLNPLCSLRDSSSTTVLEKKPTSAESSNGAVSSKESSGNEPDLDGVLVVRRPVKEFSGEEEGRGETDDDDAKASAIDAGLTEFAKKMPMFEPERVKSESKEKLLTVNLDLALYRAKVLARNFRFVEAEAILQKVWRFIIFVID